VRPLPVLPMVPRLGVLMRGELFSGGTIRISLSDWRHGQAKCPGCGLPVDAQHDEVEELRSITSSEPDGAIRDPPPLRSAFPDRVRGERSTRAVVSRPSRAVISHTWGIIRSSTNGTIALTGQEPSIETGRRLLEFGLTSLENRNEPWWDAPSALQTRFVEELNREGRSPFVPTPSDGTPDWELTVPFSTGPKLG
jgi:hypothetical protein